MTIRVALLFSGGKDSTYATWIVQHQAWQIASLVTIRSPDADSLMFHYPGIEWTSLQAKALGLNHILVDQKSSDTLSDLEHALATLKSAESIDGVVTGAVASEYQKTRFDRLCDSLGLKSYSPLWHKNPSLLVSDLKNGGYRILLSAVAANGLDEKWLGIELNEERWTRLEGLSRKYGIHLAGEGGEYESFVLDAPNFQRKIVIEKTRIEWNGQSGRLIIEKASLGDKSTN